MGKQGSAKSPRPEKQNLARYPEPQWFVVKESCDLSIGRRLLDKAFFVEGSKNDLIKFGVCKGGYNGKRNIWWLRRRIWSIIFTLSLIVFLLFLDSLLFSILNPATDESKSSLLHSEVKMYDRLLKLASISLAKRDAKHKTSKFWEAPNPESSKWRPCAEKNSSKVFRTGKSKNTTGFILVSANGGLNQQRVAVCNAVAVASLLNATLVIPKFLYSNVWKDPSQFGDIYQEEYFMKSLKSDINIVKELPSQFKSLNFEAIGSLITDADLSKEAKPQEYIKKILPVLLRNGVVHFLGFGNRLGFDPLPSELQRLRCKCNFHALKFSQKIQKVGELLIKRIRNYNIPRSALNEQLLGNVISELPHEIKKGPSKYLALHLRFEVDMVAYSMCEFGGGENERRELQVYREKHFPLVLERLKNSKPLYPDELRKTGRCPLTPEEAALVLAALGFNSDTYIYLAGSRIYGGESRMNPLTSLYPNLVTKETLLSPSELAPFSNFSSQLAALDFIACATSDVFAITDSGSQLSSLVSGFRTYYGGGHAPTLRPSKKRLATILSENATIGWSNFEDRSRKMIKENQRVHKRGFGQSIYRQPRSNECMCNNH